MSFDLNFYKKPENKVSKSEMDEYLSNISLINSETDNQWIYENENTGAYCSFDFYESESDDEEYEEENFGDLIDVNFSFNINYVRPQFFGMECFDIVESFVDRFDLYVLDPQAEGEPMKYPKGKLLESWMKSNEKISKSYFKEWELKYLDLEKSNYSWKFCYNKEKLQAKLGEEYFVPNIFYINKNGTETIETLSVWPEHIPFVLPKVDFILIQRKLKKLFRTKDESGLVKYETIINKLGEYFEDEDDYKIIHPNNAEKIKSIFNSIEFISSFEKYGNGVSVDKIVNFKDE